MRTRRSRSATSSGCRAATRSASRTMA
jgi:hypothetical protein